MVKPVNERKGEKMFDRNDKSLFIFRKIVNVLILVFMCVCVVAGIVLMAMSIGDREFYFEYFLTGILLLVLGPIALQLIWLAVDMKYNAILDVKIIRNAQFGLSVPELPYITFGKSQKKECFDSEMGIYERLKQYKVLVDEGIISQVEFNEIKAQLLNKNDITCNQEETTIDKIKKLKTYADEKIITDEEFAEEKSKLLKK